MRGRKKEPVKDFRLEKMRPIEAANFLGVDERFFFRLVENEYISKGEGGLYSLGDVVKGYVNFLQSQKKLINLEKFTLTFDEAVKVLGISKSAFYQLIQAGYIRPKRRGEYLLIGVINGYIESVSNQEELTEAKIELIKTQTNVLEHKIKEKKGELLPTRDVMKVYTENVLNIRSKLLALPSRLSPLLVGCDVTKIHEILKSAIYEMLFELADYDKDRIDRIKDKK